MNTPFRVVLDEIDCPSLGFSSVSSSNDGMFAATYNEGIYRKRYGGKWEQENQGLPEETVINRLQQIDGRMYACSNKGLFSHDANQWYPTDIRTPCYQVMKLGGCIAAATEYGLWCEIGKSWESIAYPNLIVYDLLITPQYYFLGFNKGISLYDRYTDLWAEFQLETPITSLAVYRGYLLGVTSEGELVQGNKKGGFTKIGFGGLSIYYLKSTDTGVYICSNRGLYRLEMIGQRLIIRSLFFGCSVTDMNLSGDSMYIATLNQGLKKVVFN